MKKITTLIISLALILSLLATGCSSGNAAGSAESAEAAEAAEATEAAEAEAGEAAGAETGEYVLAEHLQGEVEAPELGEVIYSDEYMEAQAATCYLFSSLYSIEFPVVFFAGLEDVPYASLIDLVDLLNRFPMMVEGTASSYELTWDLENQIANILKNNGCEVKFSWDDGSWVAISDIDTLAVSRDIGGGLVHVGGVQEDGESVNYLKHMTSDENHTKSGSALISDLEEDYGIQMFYVMDDLYIPIGLFSDLFLGNSYKLLYNGQALFLINGVPNDTTLDENGNTLYDIYYSAEPSERSETLSAYTYSELCFIMDLIYGLSDQHSITSFDEYFISTGLADALKSTDPQVFDMAIGELVYNYLADVHSTYTASSAFAGADYTEPDDIVHDSGCRVASVYEFDNSLQMKREAAGLSEDGLILNGYEEVGDTAYITFDSFEASSGVDYYGLVKDGEIDLDALSEIYMSDTLGLVIYANAMINRENSPIANVVIDLLCNGGGEIDAAAYIGAWILGDFELNIKNKKTSAEYTNIYQADVDLDGEITEADSLDTDKLNVYCLISPSSFSCGNLIPSVFKSSKKVTLIGQKSGGGACAIYPVATADGTLFNTSSSNEFCIFMNGSYYSVDEGIDPDIYIKHLEKLFDREWLTEYLAGVN